LRAWRRTAWRRRDRGTTGGRTWCGPGVVTWNYSFIAVSGMIRGSGSREPFVVDGVLRLPALHRVVIFGAAEQWEVFGGALRHRHGAPVREPTASDVRGVVHGPGIDDRFVGRPAGALVAGGIRCGSEQELRVRVGRGGDDRLG